MVTGKTYLVIAGPTGAGKSGLALHLASELGGEIINCDSVQLYRGFDIGSAKATASEQAAVAHHLLDLSAWDEDFDAARYAMSALEAKAAILARGHLPVVVGGTGLYLRALLGQGWHAGLPQDAALRAELAKHDNDALMARLQELDPVRAAELHRHDRVRLSRSLELVILLGGPLRAAGLNATKPADPQAFVVILEPPRATLHARIADRTQAMLARGLVAEVTSLRQAGVSPACKPMQSIGYKQVCQYLDGDMNGVDLPAAISAATRQYAKRQCTWFRGLRADLRLDGSESLAAIVATLKRAVGRKP